jgi:hypothetical protein
MQTIYSTNYVTEGWFDRAIKARRSYGGIFAIFLGLAFVLLLIFIIMRKRHSNLESTVIKLTQEEK